MLVILGFVDVMTASELYICVDAKSALFLIRFFFVEILESRSFKVKLNTLRSLERNPIWRKKYRKYRKHILYVCKTK